MSELVVFLSPSTYIEDGSGMRSPSEAFADWCNETMRIQGDGGVPARLYRFLQDQYIERIVDVIALNQLYLCSMAEFNDILDGHCEIEYQSDEDFSDLLIRQVPLLRIEREKDPARFADIEGLKRTYEACFEQRRREVGVSCLAAVVRDPLLWAHYARGHRGLSIEFDTRFFDSNELRPHPVRYATEPFRYVFPRNTFSDLNRVALTKQICWQYEREFRIYHEEGAGLSLRFPPAAISGIYFGSRAESGFIERVRAISSQSETAFNRHVPAFKLDRNMSIKPI